MENSHLLNILKTFSPVELRECRKWIQSPAHNLRQDVEKLYDLLVKSGLGNEDLTLDKQRLFGKIFPGEPYDDAKMRQCMHFLLKAIEDFLCYQILEKQEVRRRVILATEFSKRKLEKAPFRAIKQAETELQKLPFRNLEYHQQLSYLNKEKSVLNFYEQGEKRTSQVNLQEVSDGLDVAFIAEKLQQACLILSHKAVYKTEYSIGLLDAVLEEAKTKDYLNIPAVAVYYYIYLTIADKGDTQHFELLNAQIKENGHYFPAEELKDIYQHAINYCIGKVNIGDATFWSKAFALMKAGIEKKVLFETSELLSKFTFLNVVSIGVRLEEYDWVKNFIAQYAQFLNENIREETVAYCRAILFTGMKDYRHAMPLLAQLETSDILINLNAKKMLLKIYYEQNEFDVLESLLESFRIYLKRKEVISYHKPIYGNLIYYTKKLLKANPYKKDQIEKLRLEITEAKQLTEKQWLLEQLEQL